jgi:putative membrane protein
MSGKIGLSIVFVAAQMLVLSALAQQPADPARTRTDRSSPATTDHSTMKHGDQMKPVTPQAFATQAATISQAEVELGQLALQNSQDENVKKFAQRMVKDHTASNAKLKSTAAKANVTLPQSLDAKHQAAKQKLSTLKGEQFDQEYAKTMAKGHDEAVALFESATQTQQLPTELKEFAASTLPTLKEHREMAHALHGKEGA